MTSYLLHRLRLKNEGKAQPVKKIYYLPKRSKKAIAEQKIYSPFVAEYLSRPENKYCNIRWENCTRIATCINHLKRRFKDTKMNEKFIEPSCSTYNLQIEHDDARARKEGHLLSKFLP